MEAINDTESALDRLVKDEWYRAAFESLPFPTLILDQDMVVRDANATFLKHYGKVRQEVLGRPCHWVFYRSDQPCPASRCRFHAAFAGQHGCLSLHHYQDKEGREVYEQVRLAPMLGPDGQVVGVLETISDVTQAKHLEQSLTATNEFLSRLLDSMVGVVVAADLSGRITFVNKNVETVLGYTQAELLGRPLWEIARDDQIRRVGELLSANGGRALGVRTVVLTKDGQEVPIRLNSSFVYRDGQPVGTVGVIADLRERLKMEDSLVQARMQVVQSDKLARLGRMAAGVAHELNNPLTGITVYTELVKESLPPDHPAQTDLSAILEDADRCRDIVRGLLDYSRQSQIVVEDLELSEVVEDAFHFIRDDSVFLHVEVVRRYSPEPLPIEGDPKLLRQVFINLLMNAVEAMEGRGRLMVRTRLGGDGMRVAEISDTGPGIRPQDVPKVFDPFFTTKEVGKGTGLGLSVAYGVINRHGGRLLVKETGPTGTTFQVRLPEKASPGLKSFADNYRPGPWPAKPPENPA